MGGANSNQLIEYVHSYDTRSWSCLHVAEGSFLCKNVVVQNNDIGPCGSDKFQQWADGISVSCRSAIVHNNEVTDATDGGIVLFGSPGTRVEHNTIRVISVRYTSHIISLETYHLFIIWSEYITWRNKHGRFSTMERRLYWNCRAEQRHHGGFCLRLVDINLTE
jgi:parallel beta-helix repeat protein